MLRARVASCLRSADPWVGGSDAGSDKLLAARVPDPCLCCACLTGARLPACSPRGTTTPGRGQTLRQSRRHSAWASSCRWTARRASSGQLSTLCGKCHPYTACAARASAMPTWCSPRGHVLSCPVLSCCRTDCLVGAPVAAFWALANQQQVRSCPPPPPPPPRGCPGLTWCW